jgi:hydrogenase maturation protease
MSGTLVAGVGNVLLGDDGFGVEVVRRLAGTALPAGVEVADFGIRGVHLAYQLLDGYDLVVLVDALGRGGAAGTIYVLEPELGGLEPRPLVDGHGLDPATVLGMVKLLGGAIGRTVVVGCEPARLEEGIGLSAPVAHAVDEAVRLVRRLVGAIDKEARA